MTRAEFNSMNSTEKKDGEYSNKKDKKPSET